MDRRALEPLLREHAPAVLALCHHVAGAGDARDAAQEALARIVSAIASFDASKGSFRTWALTVARNVCRDRLRRRGLERAAFRDDGESATAAFADRAPDPERLAIARADSRVLGEALERLPEPMRVAIVMFHVHEATYEEIATALAVPMGTVMTWLHRGRRRLRDAIEARNGESAGETSRSEP